MREKHAKAGHFATDSNIAVAQRSDVIWLAVKPDVIPAVLTECGPTLLKKGCLVVSIAAGVTLSQMEAALPEGGLSAPPRAARAEILFRSPQIRGTFLQRRL